MRAGPPRSPAPHSIRAPIRPTRAAALGELRPADREILLLRSYQARATDEAAHVLDIQPDAVRQRHSRAVRRLAEQYNRIAGEDRQVT